MDRKQQIEAIMAEVNEWESGDKSAFIEDLLSIHMTDESVDDAYCCLSLDEDEYKEEHDGQPDEAQEWHDFDPDC